MLVGGSSIQLLRVFGIRIGASPSWFVVLFIFIYLASDYFRDVLGGSVTQAYVVAVAAVFLFFVSLVMHELGHALVARREGIEISGIDLWLFGGVAKMARDTTSPGAEFRIAVAGPLVTLVLVVIFVAISALVQSGSALDVARLAGDAEASPTLALLGTLASINLMLLIFNLIPAFPLDGGRIARAVVWRVTGDRNRATRVAGRIGEGFAYLLIGIGIFLAASGHLFNGLWLAVIGWFIAQSARAAVVSTAFTERIDGITVADIMDAQPVSMPARTAVSSARDEYFLRYRWEWFPSSTSPGTSSASCASRASSRRSRPAGRRSRSATSSRRARRRPGACAPTARSRRCSATSTCARAARSWRSTPTACCAASSRSSRCAAR